MASVWKQNKDVTQHPKRNNHDMSFMSHCTFKFGYLYPTYIQPVVPGDSIRIRSAFDLKLMPLVFPVQSRMRAHMHYFYVRNKNLWDNWEDWLSGLKSSSVCPPPYVAPSDDKVTTGSIYDFLGTPTTVVTQGSVVEQSRFSLPASPAYKPFIYLSNATPSVGSTLSYGSSYTSSYKYPAFLCGENPIEEVPSDGEFLVSNPLFFGTAFSGASYTPSNGRVMLCSYSNNSYKVVKIFTAGGTTGSAIYTTTTKFGFKINSTDVVAMKSALASSSVPLYLVFDYTTSLSAGFDSLPSADFSMRWNVATASGVHQYHDLGLNYFQRVQTLDALPFRAYESIYYAFYANSVLQPLEINGVKEYNKFNHNTSDGRDITDYHLFKRNYELDFLTSCLPSPQMGNAPLVGMTALGDITIEDENGITTAHATVDNDGTISKVVLTSPAASVDHARTAMNIAAAGFSINDFRNVNALQRFLEQALRSGYRYRDFIKGQFGREPEYRVLDMPEFIGGFSRDVSINTTVSQADTLGIDDSRGGASLGSFVGNGRVVGAGNSDITHYCDDYGFVIGICCVTPTPAYSQLLPKYLITPTTYLDKFFPEFSQIGMQPVTYREVFPLQAYIDSITDPSKSVDDVFGYQRPYYDMVGRVDEVHGEFRGSMRNFLVNRIFDGRPELGSSFLEIDPSEVNDIFQNTNVDEDHIIGHIAYNVSMKRSVPRVHVAGLGY